jgi:CMP-N,N'-diacetyllegionaminic acid synthase
VTFLLGFIPARSGSKRLPDKNVRQFGGSSLLTLAIKGAMRARGLDAVALSTDSEAYLTLARDAGLEEGYRRPPHLASDETSSADTVIDYLDWRVARSLLTPSHVVLLQPTSPFRDANQIDAAITAWRRSGKPGLVSVAAIIPDPAHLVFHDDYGRIVTCRSADKATAAYILDGAIYIAPVELLRTEKLFWNNDSAVFVNRYPRPFDIDDETDFLAAEAIFKEFQ